MLPNGGAFCEECTKRRLVLPSDYQNLKNPKSEKKKAGGIADSSSSRSNGGRSRLPLPLRRADKPAARMDNRAEQVLLIRADFSDLSSTLGLAATVSGMEKV